MSSINHLTLGIDIGTSGVRTAVLHNTGHVISQMHVAHRTPWREQVDALEWEWAVHECLHKQIRELRSQGLNPHSIQHIGIDGTSGSMVLVDAKLQPIGQALMYNSGGFTTEAQTIAHYAPDPHISRGVNSALARALYLLAQDKDKKACYLLHQADFIVARLMKKGGYSDYNNCLKTGFDPVAQSWPEWIAQTGMPMSLLPKPLPMGTPIGTIHTDLAEQFDLSTTVKIHAGTTDSIAAFLAASPIKEGNAVTSLGTTLSIKLLSPKRFDMPDLGIYSHRLANQWLVGCALKVGAGLLLKCFRGDQLATLSAQIDPHQPSGLEDYLHAHGQVLSTDTPLWLLSQKAHISPPYKLLHFLLESLAWVEKYYYDQMINHAQCQLNVVFSAGGGAKNTTWGHIRENMLGMKITSAQHTEAAIGAARSVWFANQGS